MGESGPQVFMGVCLGRTDTPEGTMDCPVFRAILFDGNASIHCPSSSLFLGSAGNIIVQNNLCRDADSRKINPPEGTMMQLSYAGAIRILNNRWVRSPCVPLPGAIIETGKTRDMRWGVTPSAKPEKERVLGGAA